MYIGCVKMKNRQDSEKNKSRKTTRKMLGIMRNNCLSIICFNYVSISYGLFILGTCLMWYNSVRCCFVTR